VIIIEIFKNFTVTANILFRLIPQNLYQFHLTFYLGKCFKNGLQLIFLSLNVSIDKTYLLLIQMKCIHLTVKLEKIYFNKNRHVLCYFF